jgi:hypothetical protein
MNTKKNLRQVGYLQEFGYFVLISAINKYETIVLSFYKFLVNNIEKRRQLTFSDTNH